MGVALKMRLIDPPHQAESAIKLRQLALKTRGSVGCTGSNQVDFHNAIHKFNP
jgi:hypothetical protein